MSSKGKSSAETGGGAMLVPKLRFAEFENAGVWKPKRLGALFSQREETGRTNLRLLSLTDKEGIIPQEESNRKNTSNGDLSRYLRVMPGDIAYNTMRMWEGRNALSRIEGIVSPAYTVCSPTRDANSVFFSYYFKTPQLIAQFARYSQGLVKDTLNLKFEAFSRILAATPLTLPEQQKIAACLASLDALIAAQRRKVEALRAYKKGLMQQLFPQEGETQPRLRFPAFRDAGEWEFVQLGKLLGAAPDYGVNAAAVTYDKELPQYLRITDISEDGIYLSANKVSVDLVPNSGNYLEDGDIAIARTGASVGKSYRYRTDDGKLVFAGFLIRLRPDQRKLVTVYLAQYMMTRQYRDWIAITSSRSGQPGVNSAELSSLIVPLPANDRQLKEQRRIVDCLTSLDDLICAHARKLEKLKNHKKGLMQQLFPPFGED